MDLKNYLKEIWFLCKEHDTLIPSFILISILLIYIKIPFASILLILIFVFYLSKTKDFKDGWLFGKVFQFVLFFIFLVLFMILILAPTTILFLGLENLTLDNIFNSVIVKNVARVCAYLSTIFLFAPYRIFDANVNVFKALKYSILVVKNNFILFLLILVCVFCVDCLVFMTNIQNSDIITYVVGTILTIALYRLNVKQTLRKGDINENN